jgi:hypothetical protein
MGGSLESLPDFVVRHRSSIYAVWEREAEFQRTTTDEWHEWATSGLNELNGDDGDRGRGALLQTPVAGVAPPQVKIGDEREEVDKVAPRQHGLAAKGDVIKFLRWVLAADPVAVPQIEARAREAGYLAPDQMISQSKPFRNARKALVSSRTNPKA